MEWTRHPHGHLFSALLFIYLFALITCKKKTSTYYSFVALMTFGNYVLFNLLVAILVEGFSTEVSYKYNVLILLVYKEAYI
jgi:hypothetical protein